MDSPSTNRAALRLLERKYPSWICMTCCVHAMNLVCKDLANENKTSAKHTVVGGFLKQVQHISKVLSDCDTICNALQVHQTANFGDVREIATHCATRFAILHKICRDMQRSKAALCDMVTSGALLDPINFKYLNHVEQPYPDFEILTEMQRVELEPTIARLAEVPIRVVQAELSKFANTDWSPAMKRKALSMLSIQQPPGRAIIPIASINARKAFWSVTAANDFPVLAKAAVKLLSPLGVETAKREIYLKANVEEMDEKRDNIAPPQETLINILA
ncbi:uncharacterized protein HaLaN_23139 [Haematococcus lacustris]|uniref:DUF659 domain-containing protein n=1 Tax=Haematococcus lacustris TaxID=44745 RepID=A0A699ZS70_HAELA|nr:uncharacterized protein HaLaN_23139 [Haematococcus lacustris]